MVDETSAGGCHCGAVRYEVSGEPVWKSMCFCHSCTRTIGAPVVAWVGFPREEFELVLGTVKKYQSSDKGIRGFCPHCGTSLTYEKRSEYEEVQNGGSRPDEIYVTTVSLDNPEKHAPDDYAYFEEKIDWLHPGEGLPKHGFTSRK